MDSEIVEKLRVMMTPIFEKYCVVSKQAQDACIRGILKNGKVLDLARNKYDMAAHLDLQSTMSAFALGSSIVQKRKKINVGVSMTSTDRALVVAHNPEYEIDFDTTQRVNHSVAYVQRIIETKRHLATVRHGSGYITDIGGNPLYHARAAHSDVHSCVLVDNSRDLSRQVHRTIQAEAAGIEHKLRYCTGGVQTCYVDSTEAISLFAVQDIDPVDLVKGMHKKGTSFLSGSFHYDPLIYEVDRGYFPYFRMHFERVTVDSKVVIRFHFENDSSLGYDHDFANLLKYSRAWTYRMPDTDYVYRYDLTYVKDGLARFTVVRQNREYLGVARNEVAYRYIDHSATVRVSSWTLDYEADSNSPLKAYKQITLDVPDDLFKFLYKFGLSNDTENPDKLFTVDQLRAQARTFNETRVLNGVAFTGRLLMGPTELEQVVVAMYVLVLHDMAVENHVTAAQVRSVLGDQKARTDKRFFSTTGKIVAFSFALPVIFAHGKLSTFFEYIGLWFKSLATTGSLDVSWEKLCSYVALPSMQRYSGPGTPGDLQLSDHSFESRDRTESFVQPQTVYDLFSDVLTDDQKQKLSAKLDRPYVSTAVSDAGVPSDVATSRSLSPIKSSFGSEDDSEIAWYESNLSSYLQVKREVLWRRSQDHQLATTTELAQHSVAAVREHACYNFDVALAQVKASADRCRAVYAGAPLGEKIRMYNDAEDAGIKFLQVVHGRVYVPAGESYAFGINPATGRHHELHSNGDAVYVSDRTVSLLYVSKDTIVLNGFALGKALLAIAHKQPPKDSVYTLVDAIYGAGKTHEIVEAFRYGDVIVTQTSASKEDIYESLVKRGEVGKDYLYKAVRTADSAVMHGLPNAKKLFIDEGLMMFPGQIFAVTTLTHAKQVFVYGDSAQIPPIDRSVALGFLTYQGMCRWNTIEFRNLTYRSPADVVWVLSKFYKIDRRALLRTASPVKRSLSLQVVKNPKELKEYGTDEGWHYITMLRSDRAEFLTNPRMRDGKKVRVHQLQSGEARLLNVGEAEGGTFARVKVVRKFPYGDELFKSSCHTVVAFSRHLLEAVYVTSVRSDPFATLIGSLSAVTDAELESVMVPTPQWLHTRLERVKKTGVA